MKFSTKLTTLFLVVSTLFSTSCSKNDSEDSFGTSTGNFLPLKVGNSWTYLLESQSFVNTQTITGTQNINGSTYYQFYDDETAGLDLTQFFAKKGATYLLRVGETNINQDGIALKIGAYELPILKDDFEVGVSYTGNVSPKVTFSANGQNGTIPFDVSYNGVILSKSSVTLDGITYPNTIKTRLTVFINANGENSETTEEYWFAEDIGIIKIITTTGNEIQEKVIYNYTLN